MARPSLGSARRSTSSARSHAIDQAGHGRGGQVQGVGRLADQRAVLVAQKEQGPGLGGGQSALGGHLGLDPALDPPLAGVEQEDEAAVGGRGHGAGDYSSRTKYQTPVSRRR
jgi:hypothetical protein